MLKFKNVLLNDLMKVLENRMTKDEFNNLTLVYSYHNTLKLDYDHVTLEVEIIDDEFHFNIFNKEDEKEFTVDFSVVTKEYLYEIEVFLFKCNVVSKVYNEVKSLENFKLNEDDSFSENELSFTLENKMIIVSFSYDEVEYLTIKDLVSNERVDYEELDYNEVKSVILESI